MTEPEVRIVFVTGPEAGTLETLGRSLVEERLAACVNVIPGVSSVYRWKGEVQTDSEAIAMIKTTEDRVMSLRERITDLHPYDVPEFLTVSVTEGSEAYLNWVRESVWTGEPDVEA